MIFVALMLLVINAFVLAGFLEFTIITIAWVRRSGNKINHFYSKDADFLMNYILKIKVYTLCVSDVMQFLVQMIFFELSCGFAESWLTMLGVEKKKHPWSLSEYVAFGSLGQTQDSG